MTLGWSCRNDISAGQKALLIDGGWSGPTLVLNRPALDGQSRIEAETSGTYPIPD